MVMPSEPRRAPAMADTIRINRGPGLTLWAAVGAERLGFDRDTALTLGQAVTGLSAYAKGVSLGIVEPRPELVREQGDRLAEGEPLQPTTWRHHAGLLPYLVLVDQRLPGNLPPQWAGVLR